MSNNPDEDFEREVAKSHKILSFYFKVYIYSAISFAWILFAMYKIALLYFPVTFFMIFKFFIAYSVLELISKGFYYFIFNDEEKEVKLIK